MFWTLRPSSPLAAGFELVARSRGGDPCRRCVLGTSHTDAPAFAAHPPSDPRAVSADVGIWSGRDRSGATLLFQRGAIPLGWCRSAPGVSGAGLAHRLALGTKPPPAGMVGAGGCGPVDHRLCLRFRPSRRADAEPDPPAPGGVG